jgi:hypothetical protein
MVFDRSDNNKKFGVAVERVHTDVFVYGSPKASQALTTQ